jgi:hypothetical protein
MTSKPSDVVTVRSHTLYEHDVHHIPDDKERDVMAEEMIEELGFVWENHPVPEKHHNQNHQPPPVEDLTSFQEITSSKPSVTPEKNKMTSTKVSSDGSTFGYMSSEETNHAGTSNRKYTRKTNASSSSKSDNDVDASASASTHPSSPGSSKTVTQISNKTTQPMTSSKTSEIPSSSYTADVTPSDVIATVAPSQQNLHHANFHEKSAFHKPTHTQKNSSELKNKKQKISQTHSQINKEVTAGNKALVNGQMSPPVMKKSSNSGRGSSENDSAFTGVRL